MNVPNKLTMVRIFLIPAFLVLFYQDSDVCRIFGILVFLLASFTDFLDGYIARRFHLVTNFGKFADPLADKLLTLSALLILVELSVTPAWIAIVILARELAITALRTVAMEQGIVMAAAFSGKVKTAVQMTCLPVLMLLVIYDDFLPMAPWFNFVILGVTLYSGIDYFIINKKVLGGPK